jgi:hypothetical protein
VKITIIERKEYGLDSHVSEQMAFRASILSRKLQNMKKKCQAQYRDIPYEK